MNVHDKPTTGSLILLVLCASGAATLAPLATAPARAEPVVQPLPGEGPPTLSSALLRLGRNPHDTAALIDAGNAALAMGDTDAATGFFTRADRLMPNNAAIQAGLAGARVRAEDPFGAIPLFQSAERNGAIPVELLSDRGLAYDLVADNASAQKYYRQAIAASAGDEATRRLAVSLAIAGDRRGAEAALAPLLDRKDRSAWRTRAFVLAILGREDEAISVVRATMPAELATGIAPYLRYMRQLTPAQQAAAANLGRFPRASEIGHDDPRVAQYAPPKPVRVAVAEAAPVDPRAKSRNDRKRRRGGDSSTSADPAMIDRSEAPPEPTRISRAVEPAQPLTGELPPVQSAPSTAPSTAMPTRLRSVPATLPNARPTSAPAAIAAAPAPAPASTPTPAPTPVRTAPATPAPTPAPTPVPTRPATMGFDLARTPGAVVVPAPRAPVIAPAATPAPVSAPAPAPSFALVPSQPAVPTSTPTPAPVAAVAPAPAPVPTPKPSPAPRRPATFADAFADLASHKADIAPRAGAVDIRKITPARPAPPPPPPPPPNPSRIWVQVGVGRAESRLEYDWRKFQKEDPELFRTRKAWVSEWGRTNRLLVGPFDTEKAADSFVAKLSKAGHDDAFTWTSPAGQVVDPL